VCQIKGVLMKKSLYTATVFLSAALAPVHSEAAGPRAVHSENVQAYAQEIQLHFNYYESVRPALVGWGPHELAVACHATHGVRVQKASMDQQKSVLDVKVQRPQIDIKAWADADMAKELQSQGSTGRWPAQDGTP